MSLYQDYFHFSRDPFGITPDPAILMLGLEHRKAIGAITYGIRDRKGFIVISGEVGIGKTTVLRACLEALAPERHKIIYIFNPKLDIRQLHSALLAALYDDPETRDAEALEWIYRGLLEKFNAGVNVILAIDEAQHVPAETLEALRLISNLETGDAKLLQIILVGQSELDTLLQCHGLRQLDQRIAVRVRMAALSLRASLRYILFRIEAAGQNGTAIFTWPALYYIALRGGGIPRRLNIFCDNALVNCVGHGAARVTLAIALGGTQEFLAGRQRRRLAGWVWGGVLLAMSGVALGAILSPQFWPERAVSVPPAKVLAVTEPRVPAVVPVAAPMAPAPEAAPSAPAAVVQARHFFVRTASRGDTIYRLCRELYGACPRKTLTYVLSYNPGLDRESLAPGQFVRFPFERDLFVKMGMVRKFDLRTP